MISFIQELFYTTQDYLINPVCLEISARNLSLDAIVESSSELLIVFRCWKGGQKGLSLGFGLLRNRYLVSCNLRLSDNHQ